MKYHIAEDLPVISNPQMLTLRIDGFRPGSSWISRGSSVFVSSSDNQETFLLSYHHLLLGNYDEEFEQITQLLKTNSRNLLESNKDVSDIYLTVEGPRPGQPIPLKRGVKVKIPRQCSINSFLLLFQRALDSLWNLELKMVGDLFLTLDNN